MANPYTIGFGVKPSQYVPRTIQREEVITAFNNDESITPAYLVEGVRGSGKTVMLDEIAEKIGKGWIVINLNSYANLLNSLASKLYYHDRLNKMFARKKYGFSFSGLSVSVEENAPTPDFETVIGSMLEDVKKKNLKVLVVIDEVDNTPEMREFASAFQILIRAGLPIRLLLAGLPENIYGLSNERRSTFLMRTPKIVMDPLNLTVIKRNYQRTLKITEQEASKLAAMTKGYSFAYQVLGHVCWGKSIDFSNDSFDEIVTEFDYYLQEYSYRKMWEVLSSMDKRVVSALAQAELPAKVKHMREILDMDSNKFTVYRTRLKNQGLIDVKSYGEISFTLPRFSEFVNSISQ